MSENSNENNEIDQSRFMVEELNLDDQPTEEEVLERAEELEIDDLILARESLTKELDPEWKPYCNRYGNIYYINLYEERAYVDHPIDMFFKITYAKANDMPIPKFRNFPIPQVSQSLDLVQEEIRAFKMESHKTTLRIVYEEPSEEELSSVGQTPVHEKDVNEEFFISSKKSKEEELNIEELEELYDYERELEEKYISELEERRNKTNQIIENKEKQSEQNKKRIIDQKIEEMCNQTRQNIKKKNKLDLERQSAKIDMEYHEKRVEFCENIHKFNETFEIFREKQRTAEDIFNDKNASERVMILDKINQNALFEKSRAIENAKQEMMVEFNQKMVQMLKSSHIYQEDLVRSVNNILAEKTVLGEKTRRSNRIFKPKLEPNIQTIMDRGQRDLEYEELKKEINLLTLWSEDNNKQEAYTMSRPSLNLRLHMRII